MRLTFLCCAGTIVRRKPGNKEYKKRVTWLEDRSSTEGPVAVVEYVGMGGATAGCGGTLSPHL